MRPPEDPAADYRSVLRDRYDPSPQAVAAVSECMARGFHGGEPDAGGGFTTEHFDIAPGRRRRYYPAACAAEWYHDSARLWAMVDDLRGRGADPDLIEEIRSMARRAYELGYAWMKGALSGLPEYDSWQEEPAEGETA